MSNHPNRGRGDNPARNPKAAEIRAARVAAGLTQTEAGELVYSSLRTWQQWESEEPGDQRRMHPGLWELWQLKVANLPARKK